MTVRIVSSNRDDRYLRLHLPDPLLIQGTSRAMVRDLQDSRRRSRLVLAQASEGIGLDVSGKKK